MMTIASQCLKQAGEWVAVFIVILVGKMYTCKVTVSVILIGNLIQWRSI